MFCKMCVCVAEYYDDDNDSVWCGVVIIIIWENLSLFGWIELLENVIVTHTQKHTHELLCVFWGINMQQQLNT